MCCVRMLRGVCASAVFVALFASSVTLAAQTDIKGLIKTRSGETMLLQTDKTTEFTVFLTDATDVAQYEGIFKTGRKRMSRAVLIPGLAVKVRGNFDSHNNFVAENVRFKGNDLERARATQAGLHETNQQVEQNRQAIAATDAEVTRQKAAADATNAEVARQKAAIHEAVARFGQLDDYYIFAEATVYFANGQATVESQYVPRLQALAEKAKGIQGYMIEVKGYASITGNTALNQSLSENRAKNVTNILLQRCGVPLSRMLAPGAMGESVQVGNASSIDGQALNRRVVVRVLQNKAIAGRLGE